MFKRREIIQELIKDYESGLSIQLVAEKHDLSAESVRRRFKRIGYSARTLSEARQTAEKFGRASKIRRKRWNGYCKRGHLVEGENAIREGGKYLRCRTCTNQRQMQFYRKWISIPENRLARWQYERNRRAKSPGKFRDYHREWYRINKDKECRRQKARRNSPHYKIYRKYWEDNNKHNRALYKHRGVMRLGKWYIRQALKKQGQLVSDRNMESKKKQIRLWRTQAQFRLMEAREAVKSLSSKDHRQPSNNS